VPLAIVLIALAIVPPIDDVRASIRRQQTDRIGSRDM